MANETELKVKITAELANIKAGLDALQRELKETGDSGDSAGKRISAGLGGLAASATRAAAALAAAGVAFGAVLVKKSIDAADATGILANKLGVTTEALSRLQYAAKLSDVSQATLEASMKKLARSVTEAANGTGKAADAFAVLRLNADELLRLPADEQFGRIADALNRVQNQSQKAALAQMIYGRSAADLLPLVDEGSAGIDELGDKLERLGGIISGDTAAKAMQFNDNLDDLGTAAQGLGLAIAAELLGPLNDLTGDLVELAQQKETAEGIASFVRGIGTAVVWTAQAVASTGNFLTGLGEDIAAFLGGAGGEKTLEELYERLTDLQLRRSQANPRRPDVIAQIDAELEKVYGLINAYEDLEATQKAGGAAAEKTAETRENAADSADEQAISEEEVAAALRAGARASEEAARAAEQRQKAISDLIAKLEEEVATHGKAESAAVDYQLAQLGATQAERERAAALADTLAKLKEKEAADKRVKDQLPDVQNELLRLQGNDAQAIENQLRERFAQLIADLQLLGNAAGVEIVEKLINLSLADARLNELKARIAEVAGAFDQAQQNAANRVVTGDQSGGAARNDVGVAGDAAIAQLRAYRTELELLASQGAPGAVEALDSLDDKMQDIAAQSAGGLTRAIQDLRKEMAQMQEDFAGDAIGALRDGLTGLFYDLAEGSKSAKEALKDFARGFALAMVEIAARALATMLILQLLDTLFPGAGKLAAASGNLAAGVKHTGGIAGGGGTTRQVPQWLFEGAARYHAGGIAGASPLKPGEVPAILQRGEEVITQQDPRHIMNGGGTGGGLQNVRINLIDDRGNIGDYMSSADGERVLLETLERNSMRARTVLGVG